MLESTRTWLAPRLNLLREPAMAIGTQALPPTIQKGQYGCMTDQVRPKRTPTHLAFVLQGHRQWALRNNLPYTDVVGSAASRLLELIDFCAARGLEKVTFYIFSDDIFPRPPGGNVEVVRAFMRYITAGAQNMHRNDVHLQIDGSLHGLDRLTRGLLHDVARRTRLNTGMELVVTVDSPQMGSRKRRHCCASGASTPASNQAGIGKTDLTAEPDFVIRTGGSMPLHRPVLWNTQQTSLFFADTLWPNFDARALREALDWFSLPTRAVGIQLDTRNSTSVQQKLA